jgi:hypothetical protein
MVPFQNTGRDNEITYVATGKYKIGMITALGFKMAEIQKVQGKGKFLDFG